jgi:hypothetical protein
LKFKRASGYKSRTIPAKRPTTDEAALLDTILPLEEVPKIGEDEEVVDAEEVLAKGI